MYQENKKEEYKEWYDNGQLRMQLYYIDGKKNEEYKEWYDNGQLHIQLYYKDYSGNSIMF